MIRHGASLLRAFAAARVPKLTVVLRKAYGGAVITMNSQATSAPTWSSPGRGAEIGIMAARQAVGIVHRRRLADAERPGLRAELADAYADEHLTADAAAAAGFVDEVIEPRTTRDRLAWALRVAGGPMTADDPYAIIAPDDADRARVTRAGSRSYVALGDSFTAGTGCRARARRWPERLAAGLRRAQRRGSPTATSRSRARPAPRCSSSSAEALELEPDLVTVVCGANDVLRSTRPDPERLRPQPRRDPRPPARGATRRVRIVTATSPERWDFLELGPAHPRAGRARDPRASTRPPRVVAEAYGVPCLEVAGHPGLCEPENFGADGLHPSPLGHRRAARGFAELVRDRCGIPIAIEGGRHERARCLDAGSAGRADHARADDHRGRPGLVRRRSPATGTRSTPTPSGRPQGRFGERVAHGMLVLSYAVGLVPFDPERVVALRGLDSVELQAPGADRRHDPGRGSRSSAVRPLDDEHALVALALAGRTTRTTGTVARARVEALWRREAGAAAAGATAPPRPSWRR